MVAIYKYFVNVTLIKKTICVLPGTYRTRELRNFQMIVYA